MGKGLNSIPDKQRRDVRRRNHVARDLGERKYHQRIVPKKRRDDEEWDNQDWERFVEEDDPYWLQKQLGLTTKE